MLSLVAKKGRCIFLLSLFTYLAAYEYIYHPGGLLQQESYPLLAKAAHETGISGMYNLPYILLRNLQYLLAASGILALLEARQDGKMTKENLKKIALLCALPFAVMDAYGASLLWVAQNLWVKIAFGISGVAGSILLPKFSKKALLPAVILSLYTYAYGKNPAGFFVLGYAYGLAAEYASKQAIHSPLALKLRNGLLKLKPSQIFLLILLLGGALRAWNLMGDVGFDRGFSDGYNSYAAYELMQGKTIYKDFIYTHVPLLPYSIAAAYHLLGTGLPQARIFNLGINLISLVPLYSLTKRWFGKKEALLASFLWAIYPHTVTSARYVGHESLMTFFILLSVWMASGEKTGRNLFLSGAALGIATMAKEPAALLLIPFWIYLRQMKKHTKPWLFGFLAATLPILTYFTILGGSNFLEYNIRYHLTLSIQDTGDLAYTFFTETYRLNASSIAGILRGLLVILFFSIGLVRTAARRRKQDIFMLGWFLSLLILLLKNGFWWHYPLQFMPPLLLFTAIGFLHTTTTTERGRVYAYIAALLMVFMLLQEDYGTITKKDDSQAVVAEALGKIAGKNDLVISSMLALPLLAERDVPGELFEFGYQNPLLTSNYVIGIVEKKNVRVIVMDARVTDEKRAVQFKRFREYVKENYTEVRRFNYTYWGPSEISILVRNHG